MPRTKRPEIRSLYYITHVENLRSILLHGILSHQLVLDRKLPYTSIYDSQIVSNRKLKQAPDGRSLWQFANVYFQPRNPMLYRVVHEKDGKALIILAVRPDILQAPGAFITDGNAANSPTEFYDSSAGMEIVSKNWKTISAEWWNSVDGSKRKIMAECLIPGHIAPDLIHTIYVASHEVRDRIVDLIGAKPPVIPEPRMFFLPVHQYRITRTLSLAEGDMFFSTLQTLTVSVNTVGIMGKGLASRAKYQFPDVYVRYQDECRRKSLAMGKPFLYKREASFDEELVDEPRSISTPNGVKWFLLFATKRHWRDDSDLEGIEEGLRWVVSHYEGEGIKSLALPALGCGLGNLAWKDVGPVMCRHLAHLRSPVVIYLPREKEIPYEFLSPDYLLRAKAAV